MVIGWGNLGAAPQPPCRASKAALQAADGRGEALGWAGSRLPGVASRSCSRASSRRAGRSCSPRMCSAMLVAASSTSSRCSAQALAMRGQQLPERGHAVARPVGEVGAAEEGPTVGGQEDAHGPAALAGQGLHGVHVDGVEVGPLLAVDLDGHEVRVEVGRRGLVLERLALHDVAPVAGRVADGEEDGPVELAGAGQRLLTPGVPVHGVVGVLQQVRAGLAGQPVGVVLRRVAGSVGGGHGQRHGTWPRRRLASGPTPPTHGTRSASFGCLGLSPARVPHAG